MIFDIVLVLLKIFNRKKWELQINANIKLSEYFSIRKKLSEYLNPYA